MNTEHDRLKELIDAALHIREIYRRDEINPPMQKVWDAADKFRPKKKRVINLQYLSDGHTAGDYVRLDDDVRARLGPTAGVRATKVLSIIEHNGISNESKAARVMDLIESASVEIEE